MKDQTDRELLEAAAKAAGMLPGAYVEKMRVVTDCGVEFFTGILIGPEVCWNPLTDDGDALRLAVRLGMRVNVFMRRMEPFTLVHLVTDFEEEHRGDAGRATRRAIVRAAASIGATK